MADLNDLNNLEDAPDIFINSVKGLENYLFTNSIEFLDLFTFDENGNLTIEENIGVPEEVSNRILQLINESDYLKDYNQYVSEYDNQAQISIDLIRDLTLDPKLTASTAAIASIAASKKSIGDILIRNGLQENVITPIQENLENILSSLGTKKDLTQILNESLLSNTDRQALLTNLATTNSIDSYATANAQFNIIQSNDTNTDWFTYRGGLVRDSRDFCKKRNRKFFHRNEIKEWGNIKKWKGRKKGTNPGNIFINRGGYNCLHSIMPVSITIVPKNVLRRNIKNGNFKPTQKETEVLGL